jgi:hypothetical protein
MPQIPDDLLEGAFKSATLARFNIALMAGLEWNS